MTTSQGKRDGVEGDCLMSKSAMPEMDQSGIDYWQERADEPIRFEKIYTPEEQEAYNKKHPLPTKEELNRILEKAGSI